MGGRGSGRPFWISRKTTVERCLYLSVAEFKGCINLSVSGDISWVNQQTGEQLSSIYYRLLPETDSEPMLILSYKSDSGEVHEPVSFQKTYPYFGGVRWWFTCPVCKRRVGKLYLPVKARLFGCRRCHNLTYKSCQESKKKNLLYILIADSIGITPDSVKTILDLT